jgi:hypothetical protein
MLQANTRGQHPILQQLPAQALHPTKEHCSLQPCNTLLTLESENLVTLPPSAPSDRPPLCKGIIIYEVPLPACGASKTRRKKSMVRIFFRALQRYCPRAAELPQRSAIENDVI